MVNYNWTNGIERTRGDVVYGIHKELDKIGYNLPTWVNVNKGYTYDPVTKNYINYPSLPGQTERYENKQDSGKARVWKSYMDQVLMTTSEGRIYFVIDGIQGIEHLTKTDAEREKLPVFKDLGLMVTYRELKHAVKLIILDTSSWITHRIKFIEGGHLIGHTDLFSKVPEFEFQFYVKELRNTYKNILWYWSGQEWNGGKLDQTLTEIQDPNPTYIQIGSQKITPLFLTKEIK